jgi:hypothetical protein
LKAVTRCGKLTKQIGEASGGDDFSTFYPRL